MTNIISTLVGIALILCVGGVVYWQNRDVPAPEQNTESTNSGGETQSGGLTMAAVAEHKDGTSCWSIINGNVYDLTSWIPQHPGGPDKILKLCGKDGSEKFNNQHGGSATQEQTLAGFKIGALAQ